MGKEHIVPYIIQPKTTERNDTIIRDVLKETICTT